MTAQTPAAHLHAFHWEPQPTGEQLVSEYLEAFLGANTFAQTLARRMQRETGTRFQDWVDLILVPASPEATAKLKAAGFVPDQYGNYVHPAALFPRFLLHEGPLGCVLKADSVVDFKAVHQILASVEGPVLNPLRRMQVTESASPLFVAERHGVRTWHLETYPETQRLRAAEHLEAFRCRMREFPDPEAGFAWAEQLVARAVVDLGPDWTCDLFFQAEREYWQRRNRAGQMQKARQDRLGLGWANHDHHTYRSSRKCFHLLIRFLERLGFFCRECFTPGPGAGWGAQILEHPGTGITIFADVDMSPEELLGDFAHQPLPARPKLGTIGLWCALHGEAFLEAGMHHLECQFDFDSLRSQLKENGITTMNPFTDLGYLRQAFTEGERWPVRPERIESLLAAGHLTQEKADTLHKEGALGSHLENLERNQGFKGFNQTGIDDIIARTNPALQTS